MSSKNKVLKFVSVFLTAVLVFSMHIIPPAQAAATYVVTVPVGTTEVSIDITEKEVTPYAGIEFGLTLSSESELKFSSFEQGAEVKGSSATPFTTVSGVHYFGFYRGTNAFAGKINVGKLRFTYTGDNTQTVVLTHMQVARITNGRPSGIKKSSPVATIIFKRAVGDGPGEVSVSGEGSSDALSFAFTIGNNALEINGQLGSKYFDDVDASWFWAAKEIDYLYEAGVVKGTGERMYSPAANIQRGDFILMLVRAYGLEGEFTENFSDVPVGSYYYDAIGIAKMHGVALGIGEDRFAPNDPMTRQDMMTLVARTLSTIGKPLPAGTKTDLEAFLDWNKVSSYAEIPVATLIKSGIIKGDDQGMIQPLNHTSRAEIAVVVYRLLTMETQ